MPPPRRVAMNHKLCHGDPLFNRFFSFLDIFSSDNVLIVEEARHRGLSFPGEAKSLMKSLMNTDVRKLPAGCRPFLNLAVLAPAQKICKYCSGNTMDIQVESRGDRRIIRIKDKITFEHCPLLQSRLDGVLEPDVREVFIDFRDVPFMDSSGIGEILRLYKLVRDRHGELVLINPNQKLRNLFTMYRFEKFMKIRESVEAGEE